MREKKTEQFDFHFSMFGKENEIGIEFRVEKTKWSEFFRQPNRIHTRHPQIWWHKSFVVSSHENFHFGLRYARTHTHSLRARMSGRAK